MSTNARSASEQMHTTRGINRATIGVRILDDLSRFVIEVHRGGERGQETAVVMPADPTVCDR